jgi:hypothetical protein
MMLEFKWTTSRGRDSYGYNICSLYVDGCKVSSCNGGGYDMEGTAFGNWLAKAYADKLRDLPTGKLAKTFYGLTYHDPNYDPGKAKIGKDCTDRTMGQGSDGKTVADAEAAGESLGLERYQAFYSASSKHPTKRHTVPLIDGACGMSSVQRIAEAIGLTLEYLPVRSQKLTLYKLTEKEG